MPGRRATTAPHFLFYGHYDVQPPDPLDLWQTPPFEPRLADTPTGKQIIGRGVADDKGQLMTFIEALRAFKETGEIPCHITILLEGEEETGSPSLPGFLAKHRDELKADLALVCDTGMWDRATPAITTMLRGLVLEESHHPRRRSRSAFRHVRRSGDQSDPRACRASSADLHDDQGRVTLPGFYDGVAELPDDIAAQWRALPFDANAFLGDVGPLGPGRRERPQRA